MASSKAPPAPNYVGAAQAQGAANVEAARATGMMNNPNVFSPYGTQTVTWHGDIPTVTQNLGRSEAIQKALEDKSKMMLGNAGNNTASQIDYNSWHPMNFGQSINAPGAIGRVNEQLLNLPGSVGRLNDQRLALPESVGRINSNSDKYRQDVIDAMMARVNTGTNTQRDTANSQLIAAGLRPGTAAYNNAMDSINRQYNDARQQAILSGGAEAARSQGMDINALQTNEGLNQADFSMQEQQRQQQASDLASNQQLNQSDFAMQQQQRQQQAADLAANQALNQSDYGMTMDARKQRIAEILAQRQQPLNELAAMQSGTQLNNPFAGGLGYQGGAQVGATPIAAGIQAQGQSAQNLYNLQQANRNANISAGAGLVGSLGGAYLSR